MTVIERPRLRLKPKADRRVRGGHPWVFSNEIEMDAAAKELPAGALVALESASGRPLGLFIFNCHPLIAARRLSEDPGCTVDSAFFADRLARALAIRERLFGEPFYRLIHAESDGLPGTILDRFGEHLVLQVNTAGMERLLPELLEAIEAVLRPSTLVLRNDSPTRRLEELETYTRVVKGSLEGPLEIRENGLLYLADLAGGQKTGWFFDQRDNRAFAARLVTGAEPPARVLDAYSFGGGFALMAARAGARQVVALDSSAPALELCSAAAALNGLSDRVEVRRAEVFGELARMGAAGESFDLVIADPPAFAKSRKDLPQALKGYRKLARLAAPLVAPGGYLLLSSCSQPVEAVALLEEVRRGLHDAGRGARLLRSAGASPDHPVHPFLPESAYLKALFFALD